jgi:AcrR family transcriptional regulator
MSKREESSKHTRIALITAARELFYERGYAAIGTEEIVCRAGLTRGALYHHFDGKAAIFEAVFEEVDTDLLALLRAAVDDEPDAYAATLIFSRICLDHCLDAKLVRLALLDAPTVLGWSRWREIELRYGLGLIIEMFSAGMAAGRFRRLPVEPVAYMYFASLMELGMYLGNAEDKAATRVEVEDVLVAVLESLLLKSGGKFSAAANPG